MLIIGGAGPLYVVCSGDAEQHAPMRIVAKQNRIAGAIHPEAASQIGRQLPAVDERYGERASPAREIRHPQSLQQHHVDVAAAFTGRTVQGVSELLDLVPCAGFFEGGRDNRKSIFEPLSLPAFFDSLRKVAEIEPEPEAIGISVVVPNAGAAIDTELRDRAVPGQSDDVAGRRLVRMDIRRTAHVLPQLGVLGIARLGLGADAFQNAATRERLELFLMLLEADRVVA